MRLEPVITSVSKNGGPTVFECFGQCFEQSKLSFSYQTKSTLGFDITGFGLVFSKSAHFELRPVCNCAGLEDHLSNTLEMGV